MNEASARDHILDQALAIDNEQFEQLCKMVIERAEQTRELELTPFRGDGGIDIHAIIDRDLFHARLGVQAKQYSTGNTVGSGSLRGFKGALSDQEYHIGTFITTSSFTTGAEESAQRDYIRLIDGQTFAEIMAKSELGVRIDNQGTFSTDREFWELFEKPEDSDIIPSIEVPQADNFEILRLVLRSIELGRDIKPEIADYVRAETGESFDPRQADYYGMAAWLLDFGHKEQRVETEHGEVRRWGLTRAGEEFLEYLDRGDEASAEQMLHDAIRDVEVVSRVYANLETEGSILRSEIAEVLAEETELSGSTTGRRARTVGRWLAKLPEVRTEGGGADQRFEYVRGDLGDFS